MSIASHVPSRIPLAGDDAVVAAVALCRDLGGADVVEGGRLVRDEADEEIGDLTAEFAYTPSHTSKSYAY